MRWAQPGAAAAAAALALAAFPGGGSGGPELVRGPAEASAPNVSSNWAGYVATGTASTTVTAGSDMAFTDVTGRWRQPAGIDLKVGHKEYCSSSLTSTWYSNSSSVTGHILSSWCFFG